MEMNLEKKELMEAIEILRNDDLWSYEKQEANKLLNKFDDDEFNALENLANDCTDEQLALILEKGYNSETLWGIDDLLELTKSKRHFDFFIKKPNYTFDGLYKFKNVDDRDFNNFYRYYDNTIDFNKIIEYADTGEIKKIITGLLIFGHDFMDDLEALKEFRYTREMDEYLSKRNYEDEEDEMEQAE